ncbi:MAG: hypothetical protein IJV99_03770 [Clostridia bacterium]|nr:hypothetical protein [Clostridia bacterium]
MEILQFLLSFFLKNSNADWLKGIVDLLSKNSFNIGETLKNLSPETLEPIIKEFSSLFKNQNPTEYSVGQEVGLSPIANLGDSKIIYTLNKYFNA